MVEIEEEENLGELSVTELKRMKEAEVATATANASAVAEVKETASPEAPPSEISWRIVCYMYAVGFGISLVLGAIQLSGVAENLVGSWLIFMPFGPCLLYALTRHWQQARKEKAD